MKKKIKSVALCSGLLLASAGIAAAEGFTEAAAVSAVEGAVGKAGAVLTAALGLWGLFLLARAVRKGMNAAV